MPPDLFASIVSESDGRFRVKTTMNARDAFIGLHCEELGIGFVKDGVRLPPEIKVPVVFRVNSQVYMKPSSIFMGGVRVGERKSFQVIVATDNGRPVSLVNGFVEPRVPFQVTVHEGESTITFTVSCQSDGLLPSNNAVFRAIVKVGEEEYTLSAPTIF